MALPKWTKKDLLEMDELGYWIIPCKDEQEAIDIKDICKKYGRCAQNGRIFNRDNEEIFFVLTKDRGAKKGDKPVPLTELENKRLKVIKND